MTGKQVKVHSLSNKDGNIATTPQVAVTRSSNHQFNVPKTHDMVRSLFDPSISKSPLEIAVVVVVLSNFAIYRYLSPHVMRYFLYSYIFWRVCYNFGIGVFLHYQSRYEWFTVYCKKHKLFDANNKSMLSFLFRWEVQNKSSGKEPVEVLAWFVFRSFVDLILMQDFTTYLLYVYSASISVSKLRLLLGFSMVVFNIWVKIDAHRVVKDYAWYWGDFFFYLKDSKLTFDGVFNVSPHPMYSIGYLGYYGLSLISGNYQVLLVSLFGHLMQFAFLKYVESPHIDAIYGPEATPGKSIDHDLWLQYDTYFKPLVGLTINFNFLRVTDWVTLVSSLFAATALLNSRHLFLVTLGFKVFTTIVVTTVLTKQSQSQWFVKMHLKQGYDRVQAYSTWQFLYNYLSVVSYTLVVLLAWKELVVVDYLRITFGLILVAVQLYTDNEVLKAISEFGWFYGDFFFGIRQELTNSGIYRYLNHPERFLGQLSVWGMALMTSSVELFVMAIVYTLCNDFLVKFVENPHVRKLYGQENPPAGIETVFIKGPLRRVSDIIDKLEFQLVDGFHSLSTSNPQTIDNEVILPDSEFLVEKTYIGNSIYVHWSLPASVYNEKDWIGLYSVLDSGVSRLHTLISSKHKWTGTCPEGYPGHVGVVSFVRDEEYCSGVVKFDAIYDDQVYEFRYHTKETHKVMLISKPFQMTVNPEKTLEQLLAAYSANGKVQLDELFGMTQLQQLVKVATGVELSEKYLIKIDLNLDKIVAKTEEISCFN